MAAPTSSAVSGALAEPVTFHLLVQTFNGFDPRLATDPGTEQVQALVYETLTGYDENGELQPLLAAELPVASPDGLTWTLALRPSITFHDGVSLDAAAAAAGLEAVLSPVDDWASEPLAIAVFQDIVESVSGTDLTVTFHLRRQFVAFPELLAEPVFAVIHGTGVGTGPFQYPETELPGSIAFTLSAYTQYHEGQPALAGVEVSVTGAATATEAIMGALANDQVDLVAGFALPELAMTGEMQVADGPQWEQWLLFDRLIPPLDQDAVRTALSGEADALSETLANSGLPDGFDLVVWSLQDLSGSADISQLDLSPVQITVNPVSLGDLLQGIRGDSQVPTSFLARWRRHWAAEWWLGVAGWPDPSNAISPGVMLPPVRSTIIRRSPVSHLAVTAGGWPRVTARTTLP
jgi:hypothetical protein